MSDAGGASGRPIKFVKVPAGDFIMGSPEDDPDRWGDETQHRVWVGAFEIAETTLTVGQLAAMRGQPTPVDPDLPVVNISWHQACQIANEFSISMGLRPRYLIERGLAVAEYFDSNGARLPTEEEWEYAARAGTTHRYGGIGDTVEALDSCAWTARNSEGRLHPVAEKTPNAWGLYDVSGNVWEWTGSSYQARQP